MKKCQHCNRPAMKIYRWCGMQDNDNYVCDFCLKDIMGAVSLLIEQGAIKSDSGPKVWSINESPETLASEKGTGTR